MTLHVDHRGSLFACELSDLPFDVVRIYTISFRNKGVVRGKHAHKKLSQRVICVQGSIRIEIQTLKKKQASSILGVGDFVDIAPYSWRELEALADSSVALVLCDQRYDPDDYILSIEDFLNVEL